MHRKVTLFSILLGLLAGGCDTAGKGPYLDREFRVAPKAYTNVFELMQSYGKQTEAPGLSDGVRVIKYYEKNERYAGYTNKASSWFGLITEDELKERMVKRIQRSSGGGSGILEGIVGPLRVVGGVGFYLHDGPCYFISVLKRLVSTGYDNDNGAPDFVGHFRFCRGLTVTPKEFIEKIGLADDAAEARYLKLRSQESTSTPRNSRGLGRQKSQWERRTIVARWNDDPVLSKGQTITFTVGGVD
jgi:hypothetical protein